MLKILTAYFVLFSNAPTEYTRCKHMQLKFLTSFKFLTGILKGRKDSKNLEAFLIRDIGRNLLSVSFPRPLKKRSSFHHTYSIRLSREF